MKRLVFMAVLVVLVPALGCGKSQPKQDPMPAVPAPEATAATPTPTPVPCEVVKDEKKEIKVYEDGRVDPDCIEISKETGTTVEWVAQKPADGVQITWKASCEGQTPPSLFPANPTPSGDKCILAPDAYKDIEKRTVLCYTVKVTSPGKQPVTVDPVLIINP